MQSVNNNTVSNSAGFGSAISGDSNKSGNSNDFQTFLTLLTTQMRNQDPLKPMESTEFVAQLASFSAVEQQIQTNDQLARLVDLISAGPSNGLAEWIGKEVRRPGSASYSDSPVNAEVSPLNDADTAFFVVRDQAGQIVNRTQIQPYAANVEWDGSTDDGQQAPIGRYSFEVQSYIGGNLADTSQAMVFDLVSEVRLEHGNEILVFPDGTTMPADEATAIRLPSN